MTGVVTMNAAPPPTDAREPWFRMAYDQGSATLFILGEIGWEVSGDQVLRELSALGPISRLTVRVSSVGGNVFDGIEIFNGIRALNVPITVIVESWALSAASLICMAGDEIIMRRGAMMMIHEPASWSGGTASELTKAADLLVKIRGEVAEIYAERSGRSVDEVLEMMAVETWFTGEEAVSAGFATQVEGTVNDAEMISAAKNIHMHCKAIPATVSGKLRMKQKDQAMEDDDDKKPVSQQTSAPAAVQEPQSPQMASQQMASQASGNAAMAAERQRVSDIMAAAQMANVSHDVVKKLISDGVTLSAALVQIQAHWAQQDQSPEPRPYGAVQVTADGRDKFRAGAEQAILLRAGMAATDVQAQGNEFVGMSLSELARHSVGMAGLRSHGRRIEMIGQAFAPHMAGAHGPGDFGEILANVAHKAMLRGYDEAEETFQRWTTAGTLTDFKPTKRVDLGLFPSLPQVADGAEYTYGTMSDSGELIQLATYGKMFSITRQAVLNDDLGAFTRVPQKMGRAAVRTVGNLVYAVITANGAMSDGIAMFHADHKNLGAAAAPSTTAFDAMRSAMALQKDPSDTAQALNIRPAYILVPVALEGKSRAVIAGEYDSEQGDKKIPNSVRDMAEVIADARLDANSAKAWYGVANGAIHDTVEVAYLDGQQAPYLEQRQGWSVDGTEFKVRMDAGVKALSWRTMFKNPGA